MKVIADTNILVRATMADDPVQSPMAQRLLAESEFVAIPTVALCEFVWVLTKLYRLSRPDIARAIRGAIAADNVGVENPTVAAGLALLDLGGDFADGVIAYDGRALGGMTFVSFDRTAVKRLGAIGVAAFDPVARR